MKMKPLSAAALLYCEQQAGQLANELYGVGASVLAQVLCEVACLYSACVLDDRVSPNQVLQRYTAGELADFFEEYQARFLLKGGS